MNVFSSWLLLSSSVNDMTEDLLSPCRLTQFQSSTFHVSLAPVFPSCFRSSRIFPTLSSPCDFFPHHILVSSPQAFPSSGNDIEYHSSTLFCPVHPPLIPHSVSIIYTSLSTWFAVFLSISFLVLVHLIFSLGHALHPQTNFALFL